MIKVSGVSTRIGHGRIRLNAEPDLPATTEDLGTRTRILDAAMNLVRDGGTEAATTRAVAAAASVQAPTLYRLFGDKEALLDAVAQHTLSLFVAKKAREKASSDPVEELRYGFDRWIAFGLANPEMFLLMNARPPGKPSKALTTGLGVLREKVRRIALAGRLLVSEERAVDLCHAMATGTVLCMLDKSEMEREGMAEAARDTVFSKIIRAKTAAKSGLVGAATTVRAHLDELPEFTPGERLLLGELLGRLARKK